MISICVPVFNYDVTQLIQQLVGSVEVSGQDVEILILDDGSTDEILKSTNRHLQSQIFVRYEELPHNVGRNAIRAALAQRARFEWLLFLDADSLLSDNQFIANYLKHFGTGAVLVGGRLYDKSLINSPQQKLHLRYGYQREQRKVTEKLPVFLSCNFLISKSVFLSLDFDPNLRYYGHEDTFMYLQLIKKGQTVVFINNPVFHNHIIDKWEFMQKQEEALQNLIYLQKKYGTEYDFDKVRLVKAYNTCRCSLWGRLLLSLLQRNVNELYQLTNKYQQLLFLDLWKLSKFSRQMADNQWSKPL